MQKRQKRPSAAYHHQTLLNLADSARMKDIESPSRADRQARAQTIFVSREYQSLPLLHKAILRNILRGQNPKSLVKGISSAHSINAAEKRLSTIKSPRMDTDKLASTVIQISARRQKAALFSAPGYSDKAKEEAWAKVQEMRSQKHLQRIKETLQRIVNKSISRKKMCIQIAGQLMTVSPKEREKLARALKLSGEETKIVFAVISAKNRERQNAINMKRTTTLNGVFENPLLSMPEKLKPVYKAYAKARKKAGDEYPPSTYDFFEMLRREKERKQKQE